MDTPEPQYVRAHRLPNVTFQYSKEFPGAFCWPMIELAIKLGVEGTVLRPGLAVELGRAHHIEGA